MSQYNSFTETEMREETGLNNDLAFFTARDCYDDWEHEEMLKNRGCIPYEKEDFEEVVPNKKQT